MRGIAAGDEEALRALYRQYGRLAYALALRILHRPESAEDAVQEAFLRVWRSAERFDSARSSFPTWLARIVRNLCIDALRRNNPASRAEPLDAVEWRLAQPDPMERSILDRMLVREAFLQLPSEQSCVLEMSYFEGFSHCEIAAALQIPEGTVKSCMRLGLQRMRKHLQDGTSD